MLFKWTGRAVNTFFCCYWIDFIPCGTFAWGGNDTIDTQQHLGFLNVASLCYFLALPPANTHTYETTVAWMLC